MLGFAEKKRKKKKEATAKVRVSRRTVANSPRRSVKTHQLISLEKLPKTTDVAFFKKKKQRAITPNTKFVYFIPVYCSLWYVVFTIPCLISLFLKAPLQHFITCA